MIYKLLHKLFGWDYVQFEKGMYGGISRVQLDGMKRPWYWRFKSSKIGEIIRKPEDVIWLTCSPDKYFPPSLPKQTNVDVLTTLNRAYNFIYSITDALGPYTEINGTQLVSDAYKEASALREVMNRMQNKQ